MTKIPLRSAAAILVLIGVAAFVGYGIATRDPVVRRTTVHLALKGTSQAR